ncbi:MAG: baseplate J/gp47 family protein [Proteobacteria bacterium]|nr:baseplate J/gp47 family protein [Pseudomonadota bacterium]
MVLVEIVDEMAYLDLHFYNRNFFQEILELADTAADPAAARRLFPIYGGKRVPAGSASGQVQVVAIRDMDPTTEASPVLRLSVAPIGDYSTYTLGLASSAGTITLDPLFAEIDFKFRPGCFGIDCSPDWDAAPPAHDNPKIDYLAKDYHSFKHTLITALSQRVPGWQPSSEADLDQVLLELFSAAADELSDFQDRVMNEAYLTTARKRVSVARHARLVDYHIHQGNQASTWLAIQLEGHSNITSDAATVRMPKPPAEPDGRPGNLVVWAGGASLAESGSVVFMSRGEQELHPLFNQLGLYSWSGAIPSLMAGATEADIEALNEDGVPFTDPDAAELIEGFIRSGRIRHLLIQEWRNPLTGQQPGRDPRKRQLLRLLSGDPGAEKRYDPVNNAWFVRVRWQQGDALRFNYCFTIDCPDPVYTAISLFHGNLIPVHHGRPALTIFKAAETEMIAGIHAPPFAACEDLYAVVDYKKTDFHNRQNQGAWTLCRLPFGPLAYTETPLGGVIPPKSTLTVEIITPGSPPDRNAWDEAITLIHSDESVEGGDHYAVETDEMGQSILRFGNGINGRRLPAGAEIHCFYQVGSGTDGNVGADTLTSVDASLFPEIRSCWNPFDVTNGRSPEPVAEIIRRAPEAYRYRQLRAITLEDYVNRAEELPQVSKAAARYAWTGSWRTVQIAIDPVGTTTLSEELRQQIETYLDAVRLIGEDLEIRPPIFVPLDIKAAVCIHPDYWIEDIRSLLEQAFCEGYTADGRKGFFHPDRWTFGQKLYGSEITGCIQQIEGVDHVISLTMERWNQPTPGAETDQIADVRVNEIIRVRNDPDHMEDGFMTFSFKGGRQ